MQVSVVHTQREGHQQIARALPQTPNITHSLGWIITPVPKAGVVPLSSRVTLGKLLDLSVLGLLFCKIW